MTSSENFLPILPLRDIVVFPHMIVPLFVGREKSIKSLEAVMSDDKKIFLIAQKDAPTSLLIAVAEVLALDRESI